MVVQHIPARDGSNDAFPLGPSQLPRLVTSTNPLNALDTNPVLSEVGYGFGLV